MGGQTGITYIKNTHAANHMGGHTRITPLCERRKGTHAPKIASVVGQARYREAGEPDLNASTLIKAMVERLLLQHRSLQRKSSQKQGK